MKRKILIAEDEKEVGELLSEILEELGHEVRRAGNGEEALRAMEKEDFDLLLTDIQMPLVNGLDVLKALHDKPKSKEMAVIVMTAFAKIEFAIKAMEYGARHFILKPFDAFELQKTVEYCLEILKIKEAKKRLEEEKEQDLQEAAHVQKAILMAEKEAAAIAGASGLNLVAFHQSYLHTTGDFFFLKKIDGEKLGIFLSDVCGHGTAAAMIGMRILSVIDTTPMGEMSPPDAFLSRLHKDLLLMMPGNRFAACAYAVYNRDEKTMAIANGGNPAPIDCLNGKEIPVYGSLIAQRQHENFGVASVPFQRGARLLLFTDGLVEAQNPAGEVYGEERLRELVKKFSKSPIGGLKQEIASSMEIFCEGKKVEDDVTFLILEATC